MISRLFLAAYPPASIVSYIEGLGLASEHVRPTDSSSLHATLRFFGETELNEVVARMDDVRFHTAVAILGPESVMPFGPGILLVPVGGLAELAAALARETGGLGSPPAPFWGHMEIARSTTSVEERVGLSMSATFEVSEVALVESTWVVDRPRFTVVRTWPATE